MIQDSTTVITDNNIYFINKKLRNLLEELNVKQYFTLTEYPLDQRVSRSCKQSDPRRI